MVETSDKTWSTREGNGKPLQYSCLENPMNQPRQYIKKQRHYFANKGPSSQSYSFSSSHVWIWELDYKENWAPKSWCFWTVVFEKTLESLLDSRWSNQSILKEISPEYSFGRTDVEAETPILWPPDAKNWLIWKGPDAGKDWRWEEKQTTEDAIVIWHHQLNACEFEIHNFLQFHFRN